MLDLKTGSVPTRVVDLIGRIGFGFGSYDNFKQATEFRSYENFREGFLLMLFFNLWVGSLKTGSVFEPGCGWI